MISSHCKSVIHYLTKKKKIKKINCYMYAYNGTNYSRSFQDTEIDHDEINIIISTNILS